MPNVKRPKIAPPSNVQGGISRRAGLLMFGGLLACAHPLTSGGIARADTAGNLGVLPKPTSIKYFAGQGAGSSDGSSWRNAMPVAWLRKSFPFGEPGMAYFIGFDPNGVTPLSFPKGLANLAVSGAPGNPIQIRAGFVAADGGLRALPADGPALFKSAQAWSPRLAVTKAAPHLILGLSKNASHVVLSGFHIDGTGPDGFVKFAATKKDTATFEDIVISDIHARNVSRVIETGKGASLKNVLIENCDTFGIVRAFARFWDLSDSTLRNLNLDADRMDAGIRNPCTLIHLVKGSNVTFENITLKNAISTPHEGDPPGKSYIQGDGIVCERGTSKVTIRNCHASNMGDGGFDAKTTDITIEDSSAESCKFGARIWSASDNVIRRCSFKSPKQVASFTTGCIQAGGRLVVSDTTLEAGPGTCAFELPKKNKEPVMVTMTGGSITLHEGASLAVGDKGGILELKGVAVNGVTTDKRIEL